MLTVLYPITAVLNIVGYALTGVCIYVGTISDEQGTPEMQRCTVCLFVSRVVSSSVHVSVNLFSTPGIVLIRMKRHRYGGYFNDPNVMNHSLYIECG